MKKFNLSICAILFIALVTNAFLGCEDAETKTTLPAPIPKLPYVGKSYYVSSSLGSDTNNGMSMSTPFKKISFAAAIASPGDTVFIMDGVYDQGYIAISKSGSPDKYITYKAMPGHSPKIISGSRSMWNLLFVTASYIVIEGLEFEGNNANLTYGGAQASYLDKVAGTGLMDYGFYNTNGVSLTGTAARPVHHVTIRNCKVHDFAAAGIGTGYSDYITIEANTVYNNDWYCMYASSGITTGNLLNTDNSTDYKIIIRNNICYNNYGLIFWINVTPNRLSDGNGIIIDINPIPYNGRTLVENNISFNNGGSGIHTLSAHVDIFNNTAYNNGTVVGYADIYAAYASDVKIFNNIMYSKPGGKCNVNNQNTNVTYDYNIYFNGSVAIKGIHDKVVDPQFVNASLNAAGANFSVNPGSPAVNGGYNGFAAKFDILGVARPKGGTADCGAYEVN